jgi:hypothetical protein
VLDEDEADRRMRRKAEPCRRPGRTEPCRIGTRQRQGRASAGAPDRRGAVAVRHGTGAKAKPHRAGVPGRRWGHQLGEGGDVEHLSPASATINRKWMAAAVRPQEGEAAAKRGE